MDDESGPEAIVPFQYEDEIFEEDGDEQDPVPVILQRLKAALAPSGGLLTDTSVLDGFMEDVSVLRSAWQEDPDKVALLEMLAAFARHAQDVGKDHFSSPGHDCDPPMENQEQAGDADPVEPPARGMWARLKSLFGNG